MTDVPVMSFDVVISFVGDGRDGGGGAAGGATYMAIVDEGGGADVLRARGVKDVGDGMLNCTDSFASSEVTGGTNADALSRGL